MHWVTLLLAGFLPPCGLCHLEQPIRSGPEWELLGLSLPGSCFLVSRLA